MEKILSNTLKIVQYTSLAVLLTASVMPAAHAQSINEQFQHSNFRQGDVDDDNNHCPVGYSEVRTADGKTACAQNIVAYGGRVGIGSAAPIGNLDIENSTNDATLCLNGECINSLGKASLKPEGYQVLPSGLIMEWGTVNLRLFNVAGYPVQEGWGQGWSTDTDINDGLVKFPKPFPNAVFSLVITPQDVLGYGCQETAWYSELTVNSFNAGVSLNKNGPNAQCANASNMTATWFAVGH